MYRCVSFRLVPRALLDIAGSALYIVTVPDQPSSRDIAVHSCVGFLEPPHFLALHREVGQRLK